MWRKQTREQLLRARLDADPRARRDWGAIVDERLREFLAARPVAAVGFYWPFKGEFDARPMVQELMARGAAAALPVVVEPKAPLQFWRWSPEMELEPGVYKIPIPKIRQPVTPDLLLVPLVGFDRAGYRLGYGGGYYDRTLAALTPQPFALGIGLEISRLATLYPQPHDIPMNAIATEAGLTLFRP